MCGICGIISSKAIKLNRFNVMHETLIHRGPDDAGAWFSSDNKTALGHKRLSIIDLSEGGHQPMISDDGRFIIVYNGEIYNYQKLRKNLKQDRVIFKTRSDTEVILKLWQREGRKCLLKLRGMFAFAVWDNTLKQLFIVRDPLGVKPLYFSLNNGSVAFASELKALKAGGYGHELEPRAVGAFLQWGSIPAPLTPYKGVESLIPGEWLEWEQNTGKVVKQIYWSYAKQFKANNQHRITDCAEAVELTRQTLLDSVKAHLVSDVPVGAFLSGGIDSTAIISLMRQAGQEKIDTFSIVFEDKDLDESYYSKLAAKTYSTDHHEWRISQKEFFELKNEFMESMDSPTIDGINTWMVARFARKHGFKVVTSGVGGDEFFYGYNGTFKQLPSMMRYLSAFPQGIRQVVSKALSIPFVSRINPQKIKKIRQLLESPATLEHGYLIYRQLFLKQEILDMLEDKNFAEKAACVDMSKFLPEIPGAFADRQKVSVLEVSRYLGSQLLPDSDNFSMAHALELRVPLVDRVVAENLSKIDPCLFYDSKNTPKSLLVKAVGDIPDEIVYRKKQGFTLPVGRWIKDDGWEPKNSVLNKKVCRDIDIAFCDGRMHWSRRWGIEVLDNILMYK